MKNQRVLCVRDFDIILIVLIVSIVISVFFVDFKGAAGITQATAIDLNCHKVTSYEPVVGKSIPVIYTVCT